MDGTANSDGSALVMEELFKFTLLLRDRKSVFDERYSAWHWAAFAVTVSGVILVNRTQTQGANAAHKS